MYLRNLVRGIKKSLSTYKPIIEVRIDGERILSNLDAYRNRAGKTPIAPVIKSNAYGHGLSLVAHILDTAHVPFIVVDSLYEANLLKSHGIKTPVLVIGFTPTENMRSAKRGIAFTVGTITQLEEMIHANIRATIHAKIDTGMHRQGVMPNEIERYIAILKKLKKITLEGICSHFADADSDDPIFTENQIRVWNSAVKEFKTAFPDLKYWHLAATAGIRFGNKIDANVARLGKGLYGINPVPSWLIDLKPVLEMRSIISSVRTIPPGERIGYNGTFEATHETRVATVPVGYYEGVDRRLSNKGAFLVRGIPCPIVGRVSMNITSIDVSEIPDIKIGELVTVISADTSAINSTENIAKLCSTISYEILVHIPAHLSRKVI